MGERPLRRLCSTGLAVQLTWSPTMYRPQPQTQVIRSPPCFACSTSLPFTVSNLLIGHEEAALPQALQHRLGGTADLVSRYQPQPQIQVIRSPPCSACSTSFPAGASNLLVRHEEVALAQALQHRLGGTGDPAVQALPVLGGGKALQVGVGALA